jgi:capsular exopolysaccharide synthesis family protein
MSRSQISAMHAGDDVPQLIEAFSLARANLALAVRNGTERELWDHQIIMVTSAVSGEGKSVTSAQLALSIARAGKSVILVDADLRRPAQNGLFNTDEPYGLAEVLRGEMDLDEALVTADPSNLWILHSGSATRNPTEIISLPQMERLLGLLRHEADVIVIDTPACCTVADALLLAPHVDCILHVVGAGIVDEGTVQEAAAALNAAQPNTYAFFINRAPRDRNNDYGYYYNRVGNGSDGTGANGSSGSPRSAGRRKRIAGLIEAAKPGEPFEAGQ